MLLLKPPKYVWMWMWWTDAAVFPWTRESVDSGLSVQGGILYAPLPACIALQEFFLSSFF